MSLTHQQQKVADAALGNLLISAAAGSGKTRVLVERIAKRVISGPLNVQNVLVMTFTRAAATHMLNRLESALLEAQAGAVNPRDALRISEQISMLPLAHISTIHSFCNDVIKNYGSELLDKDGKVLIEPNRSILDGTRSKILLRESVDRVLDGLYTLCHRIIKGADPAGFVSVPNVPTDNRTEPDPFTLGNDALTTAEWCGYFIEMSLCFGSGRSDQPLRDMIQTFHAMLRSLPDYEESAREMIQNKKREAEDFASSDTAVTYIAELREIAGRAVEAVREAEPLLDSIAFIKDKRKNADYADLYLEGFAIARELHLLLEKGAGWDDIAAVAARVPGDKWPGSPEKSDPDDPKRRFFAVLAPFFEMMYILSGSYPVNQDYIANFRGLSPRIFLRTTAEIQEDLSRMYPLLSRLFETVILTDRLYSEKKHAENALDYSDQEQMALQLLKKPDVARYYRELFTEIYIDEYQDNSRIQDAIIASISDNNVFYVGDVKQSIYRFRHARPDMFTARSDRYRDGGDGTLLELNGNFRSRSEILTFVNDLFSQLMSRPSGEIEYDDSQRLDPMRTQNAFAGESREVVQLILLDRTKADIPTLGSGFERIQANTRPLGSGLERIQANTRSLGSGFERIQANTRSLGSGFGREQARTEENSTGEATDSSTEGIKAGTPEEEKIDAEAIQAEGLFVLRTIRELIERFGCLYSDFAVLCRTNREAAAIAELIGSHGMPAQGPSQSALFADRELLLMNNLILLIDNMRQDIPLCSVMRANFPDASFTPGELLHIYLFACENNLEKSFFHEKVVLFSQNGPEPLRGKVIRFLDFIDSLRTLSMHLKVSELIERIYLTTGMMDRLSGEENGLNRVAALETFREWANAFESGRRGGLYSFVRYIDEINRGEHRPEDFEAGEQIRNAVRCNSIHKSKGLEYKIVFVCGIAGSFSRQDESGAVLLNDIHGIASDYFRLEKGYKYPTVPKLLLMERERRAGLSESMRLLYVAATRAEERLYLVGSFTRKKEGGIVGHEDFLAAPLLVREEKLPPRMVMRAGSFLDFLLLGLARNPAMPAQQLVSDGREISAEADEAVISGRTKDITIRIIEQASLLSELAGRKSEAGDDAPMPLASDRALGESDEHEELSEEERKLFEIQARGVYSHESLIRMPAKVTVSEMKRRTPPPEEGEDTREDFAADAGAEIGSGVGPDAVTSDSAGAGAEASGKRPINLMVRAGTRKRADKQALTPTEAGILLHSVFQYLDISSLSEEASPDDVRAELERMVRYNMIRSDQLTHLEEYFSAIADFSNSDICRRMKAAERTPGHGPFREIPFSITEPVSAEDFRLIQGMIDCWFIEDGFAVLIDYKSDRILGDRAEKARILKERYTVQLDYYARAIEAASRLKVKEKMIWLIPEATSFAL